MPSDTGAPHSIPYMVDGDPLADVADIMRTLAERVDALLDQVDSELGQHGIETLTAAGVSVVTQTIVFPVPFAAPPHMQVTSNHNFMIGTVDTITATGCRLCVRHINATTITGSFEVMWRAYPA